jgi:hypothetical protein
MEGTTIWSRRAREPVDRRGVSGRPFRGGKHDRRAVEIDRIMVVRRRWVVARRAPLVVRRLGIVVRVVMMTRLAVPVVMPVIVPRPEPRQMDVCLSSAPEHIGVGMRDRNPVKEQMGDHEQCGRQSHLRLYLSLAQGQRDPSLIR